MESKFRESPKMQFIPLGIESFSQLRKANLIYVDKTELIYELAKTPSKVFLSRPRRFGKSLLVSTLEELFRYGVRLFHGLAIADKWHDETYEVVRLDFGALKASTIEEFHQKFSEYLFDELEEKGWESSASGNYLESFRNWFKRKTASGEKQVLLIDEYDAPLTEALENPVLYAEICQVMAEFFSAINSNEACLRFLFVTGITRPANTVLLKELGNLRDISYAPEFAGILGFSEKELKNFIGVPLHRAAGTLGLSEKELLNKMKEEYEGYNFNLCKTEPLFSPWPVLNFLRAPKDGFRNYWYLTGGEPPILKKLFMEAGIKNPEDAQQGLTISTSTLTATEDQNSVDARALLTQAGYLTIAALVGPEAKLRLPTQEVARSIGGLLKKASSQKQAILVRRINGLDERRGTKI